MTKQQNKTGKMQFLRPEFFLVLITALLWLAFLAKIVFHRHGATQADARSGETTESIQKKTAKNRSEHVVQTTGVQTGSNNPQAPSRARSRNRNNKAEDANDAYIEAIRESLDKSKPPENRIIRAATRPVIIEKLSPESSNEQTQQIKQFISDPKNLDSLNVDFLKAVTNNIDRKRN